MNAILSEREHARLARELVEACGGLDEAVRAAKISKSVLSRYGQPHYAETMPARVIHALELHCGRPIYSTAMFDCFEAPTADGSLKELACDLAEQATGLQALVRKALTDGRLSPRELTDIAAAETEAEDALERLRAARRAAETPSPVLKAV
ncbi:MAG: hypothetical protein KA105_02625 [Caulobacter sp.]|nr:hypothetical protein [Caulobacter sp.]